MGRKLSTVKAVQARKLLGLLPREGTNDGADVHHQARKWK